MAIIRSVVGVILRQPVVTGDHLISFQFFHASSYSHNHIKRLKERMAGKDQVGVCTQCFMYSFTALLNYLKFSKIFTNRYYLYFRHVLQREGVVFVIGFYNK